MFGPRTGRGFGSISAAAALVLFAGCSGGEEDPAAEEAVSAEDEPAADSTDEGTAAAQASDTSTEATQSAVGDTDQGGADEGESASAAQEERLTELLVDAQALCDVLDEEELRPVLSDFSEMRPDEVTEVDSLCSMRDDRFEVGRVWVQADWSEREFMQGLAADPYEPCEVAGYAAACQSHEGDPELANGWPHVAIQIGSMGVETQAPTPAAAQELAAAVLDDLLAQPR